MEEFDFNIVLPYFLIGAGATAILIGVFKKAKVSDLLVNGEKAEGIIFELGRRSNRISNSNNRYSAVKDKVTIRFVTKSKEWITSDINQDFALFFTGQYKVGQKVDVYYEPQNPSYFVIDTKQSELMARILFISVGLVFCFFGFYKMFTVSL